VLRRAAAALVTALLLASCGSTDDAATVNDGAVTVASLEQVVADFATVGETQILNGVASGDTVRGLLTSLIRAEVVNQVLAANDVEVTQAERDEVAAQLASQGNTDLPPTLIELIITLNSANAALARVAPLSTTDIAATYDIDPKKLGVLCVRHLVVEDEATAKKARAELGATAGDEEFAKVAGKYSVEPNAAETGGALTGQSGACISLNEWQAGFDPDFVAGAFAARVGEPTQPVKSSFGWHVIYVRPFAAVAENLIATLTAAPGEYRLLSALREADVSVASRYGRWDPLSGAVVKL
jgi:parvulin-like peptidyl-prolyl isomerase